MPSRPHADPLPRPAPDLAVTVVLADPSPVPSSTVLGGGPLLDVVHCTDGAHALYEVGRTDPDVVLLSATLPGLSTTAVIATLRRHSLVPIVVGIGAGETGLAGDAVAAGADHLVRRPYVDEELTALLAARGRSRARARAEHGARGGHDVLSVGDLHLHPLSYSLTVAGVPVALPPREFELLRLLMRHADRVVTREQINGEVWGRQSAAAGGNTIAVHMARLRARLTPAGVDLVTVRGVGYRLSGACGRRSAGTPSGAEPCGPQEDTVRDLDSDPGAATEAGPQATLAEGPSEGATPGAVGALDGAAAVGAAGAVSGSGGGAGGPAGAGSVMPEGAPDPSVGAD